MMMNLILRTISNEKKYVLKNTSNNIFKMSQINGYFFSSTTLKNNDDSKKVNIKDLVKEVRAKTGAGIMTCKKALDETNRNVDEAVEIILTKAKSSSDTITRAQNAGKIEFRQNDNSGIIVELTSETDFVSNNEKFKNLIDSISDYALFTLTSLENTNESSLLNRDRLFGKILTNEASSEEKRFFPYSFNLEEFLESDYTNFDSSSIYKTIKEKIAHLKFETGEQIHLRRIGGFLSNNDNTTNNKPIINGYLHGQGRIASLISLSPKSSSTNLSESELQDLQKLAYNLCIHSSAMNPDSLYSNSSKKLPEEDVLESQEYIMDDSKRTIKTILDQNNIVVNGLITYKRGEALQSKEESD
eukprot:TRINITY_DN10843_c0_g1_i1.p1 TRINITY_DN10843_c0_g1~~TRINITY_DN10843_c0_g1_i1.p1  ORF type:complete len:358 (-),score=108.93 TRINITY_DN10843_c0_g1_i1:233-1306(-)